MLHSPRWSIWGGVFVPLILGIVPRNERGDPFFVFWHKKKCYIERIGFESKNWG